MGTTTNVKLTWFPAMHSPGDTELVVSFSDVGGGYMGRAPSLLDLMTDHVRPMSKLWSFSIHGNPVGAVYLVRGRFGGANCTLC